MEQLIEVSHVNGVWLVEARGYFEPVVFRSGGGADDAVLERLQTRSTQVIPPTV